MKQYLPLLAILSLMATACQPRNSVPTLATASDTLSWAMGVNLAMTMQQADAITPLNDDIVLQAIEHTLAGSEQPLSDSTLRDAWQQIILQQRLSAMQASTNRREAVNQQQEAYFAQLLAEHPDAKRHPKGFCYEQVKAGHGRTAKYAERVSFDYRSYLMFDGTPFDQTYGQRDPIVHTVGSPMFEGLVEALQLMNAGSIYRFYFPYQLAFGEQGSSQIPPFTPVIYEVELHEIFNN